MSMDRKVSVVGLGYVGLPVAVAFGKTAPTIGFDINSQRIEELKKYLDHTREIGPGELKSAHIFYTTDTQDLKKADFHIVAVPTPIDDAKQPDLEPILSASEKVGEALKKGDIVVFESTVYPGVTEEECVPVLERVSGLRCGVDFKVGYSPERINPGDQIHTFENIVKVVSGQDEETLEIIAQTYARVVKAGVHRAPSIRVAEAAKVIENTQRDLSIALMNELAILFDHLGIDSNAVFEAAGTKWNFQKFKPGLVGGHCIGVDPYYLTHRAEKAGFIPQVILAGRRINDSMGKFIANRTMKEMIRAGHRLLGSTVTILGLTFKENCTDIRNTKVIDILRELNDFGVNVQVHDPHANPGDAQKHYGVSLMKFEDLQPADAIILAVSHDDFKRLAPMDLKKLTKTNPVLTDVKGLFKKKALEELGFRVWCL